jgi:hypothetical protein
MSEDTPCLKGHIAFARLVLVAASLLLVSTLIASVFAKDIYASVCICTINYLSYAWIAYAIATLFSITALMTGIMSTACGCCKKLFWPNVLMWLQGLALLAGIILMVVFIARLTEVI